MPQPHGSIWALGAAGFAARCLHAVAELGVADHIGDEPVPAQELAAACGVDGGAPDRVLRLLSTQGVFDQQDGGLRAHPLVATAA